MKKRCSQRRNITLDVHALDESSEKMDIEVQKLQKVLFHAKEMNINPVVSLNPEY